MIAWHIRTRGLVKARNGGRKPAWASGGASADPFAIEGL